MKKFLILTMTALSLLTASDSFAHGFRGGYYGGHGGGFHGSYGYGFAPFVAGALIGGCSRR